MTVKTDEKGSFAASHFVDPMADNIEAKVLKAFANIFDQCSWRSLVFEWVPTVGYNTEGNIIIGVDWDAQTDATVTGPIVAAMEPNLILGLHQPSKMVVPVRKFQPQNWLRLHRSGNDTELAKLAVIAAGPASKSLGFIKITYDIRFQGTRSS